jgi:Ca2+/Na+ antiporter
MTAAARRFGLMLLALGVGTAIPSLLIGLLAGASVSRALSIGWYIVGSILLISGFFVGNRGPARPQGEGWGLFSLKRWTRWATPEEQQESISLSALLVILGFVLILFGAVADSRNQLL